MPTTLPILKPQVPQPSALSAPWQSGMVGHPTLLQLHSPALACSDLLSSRQLHLACFLFLEHTVHAHSHRGFALATPPLPANPQLFSIRHGSPWFVIWGSFMIMRHVRHLTASLPGALLLPLQSRTCSKRGTTEMIKISGP